MQYLKRLLLVVFKNGINMHQRGMDWTCPRWRPRETPAGSSGPQHQTRGTRLRRPRSPARSLRQLKRANKHNQILALTQMSSKIMKFIKEIGFDFR